MARVSTYLNFARETEAAFLFYREVFGGDFSGPIHRFKESPGCPGQPPLSEEDGELVMHVALPILGGHVLMGTDAPASMGFTLVQGNNSYLNLEPDSRGETDRLFAALAEGGQWRCRWRRCSGVTISDPWWTSSAPTGCSTARARPDGRSAMKRAPWRPFHLYCPSLFLFAAPRHLRWYARAWDCRAVR